MSTAPFFSSMPRPDLLTRSTLNTGKHGGQTVLAVAMAGSSCAANMPTLGPYTTPVPQYTLAVLVIAIGISLSS